MNLLIIRGLVRPVKLAMASKTIVWRLWARRSLDRLLAIFNGAVLYRASAPFFYATYCVHCRPILRCLIEFAFRWFLLTNALRDAIRLHGMFYVVQIASRLDPLRGGALLCSRHKFVIVGYAPHMHTRLCCQARAVMKIEWSLSPKKLKIFPTSSWDL